MEIKEGEWYKIKYRLDGEVREGLEFEVIEIDEESIAIRPFAGTIRIWPLDYVNRLILEGKLEKSTEHTRTS